MRLVPILEEGDLELLQSTPTQDPCETCSDFDICEMGCKRHDTYYQALRRLDTHGLRHIYKKMTDARKVKKDLEEVQKQYNELLKDLPEEVQAIL